MIIKNNIIPFGGYKVINLFGLIFTKSDLTDEDKNHENIHSVQILECAIAFAILISILFGLEWYGQLFHLSISGMDQSI